MEFAYIRGFAGRPLVSAFAAMLGSSACVADPEAPEDPFIPVHTSERLQIGTSFEDLLCKGEPDMWEAHLDELEQVLGVTRESTWVYVYGDDEMDEVGTDCGYKSQLLGCWRDPVVRGIRMAIPHELVHAWLDPVRSNALPVLREGIAARMSGLVMYIQADPFIPEEVGPLTLDDLVLDVPAGKYDEAGHLVAWLLASHGTEKFMALYARTTRGMSGADLSATCLELLGQTTADLLLAYQTTSRDYYPALGGSACGRGKEVPWRDGAAVWQTEASCADDPLFGFESSERWQRVTIEVPTAGWYLLDPAGREASVTRCLTEPADESELPDVSAWGVSGDWKYGTPLITIYAPHAAALGNEWAEHKLKLAAGTYEVWVQRRPEERADETSEVGLFLTEL